MKQSKNKSQKSTKKQPINVQLSQEDLVELLTTVKMFMADELSVQTRRIFLNQMEMGRRINTLEINDKSRRGEINKLKPHCVHEDRLDSLSYLNSGIFHAAVYKCKRCGRENQKTWYYLSQKERRALRKLGVKL